MIRLQPGPASGSSPPTERDYLSYSSITTYQSCPLRWFFRYVVGLPERTVSSSLVFGSAIHQAVELHFNELLVGNDPPTLDALLGEYDRYWQETDENVVKYGKDDSRESLALLAQRMLAAFQASSLAMPEGHIIGVEEQLRGRVIDGCPDLLGRIDLLVETSRELIVTDLKTARGHVGPGHKLTIKQGNFCCTRSWCARWHREKSSGCDLLSSASPRRRASSCTK